MSAKAELVQWAKDAARRLSRGPNQTNDGSDRRQAEAVLEILSRMGEVRMGDPDGVDLISKERPHSDYYRSLAEAVVRAWENPTAPPDRIYQFLDFGLTYGPSEKWPDSLAKAWAVGGMPSTDPQDPRWPVAENIEKLVSFCRDLARPDRSAATHQGQGLTPLRRPRSNKTSA